MATKNRINELFEYKDGCLYRKIRTSNNTSIGERAGSFCPTDGYRYVYVDNKNIKEHIVIWVLHNGPIRKGYVIDHKNRIRDDNNIFNLRLATRSQNGANAKLSKANKSGYKGVAFFKHGRRIKRWRAFIIKDCKFITIGYFSTAQEAAEAYNKEARKHQKDFATQNII